MKEIEVRIDTPTICRLRRMARRGSDGRRDGLGRLVWEAVELYVDRWNGPKRTRPLMPKVDETNGPVKTRRLTVKLTPATVIQLKDLARKLSRPGARGIRMEQLILEAARLYASGSGITEEEREIARDMVSYGMLSEAYWQGVREARTRYRTRRA